MIRSNPADRVERPRKEKFKSEVYKAEELEQLFTAIQGDPAEFGVIMAAFYGLRRSEIKCRSCRTKIRCGSFCFLFAVSPACADSSVPPYSSSAKGRFCPPHLWPGFPGNGRSFCRKVVLCPGKSTGRLLRPFIPPFLTDFTMFFAKKALQMNFKNILYNYRFNFFTQIVSYRFVWGSRVCAFCTASALR